MRKQTMGAQLGPVGIFRRAEVLTPPKDQLTAASKPVRWESTVQAGC